MSTYRHEICALESDPSTAASIDQIGRKLEMLIWQSVLHRSELDGEQDQLFQEVFAEIWQKLERIGERFCEKDDREHSRENYERYLHRAIRNALRLEIRRFRGVRRKSRCRAAERAPKPEEIEEGVPAVDEPARRVLVRLGEGAVPLVAPVLPDPVRRDKLKHFSRVAWESLTLREQRVLEDRLVEGMSIEAIANELGITKARASKIRTRAVLRFRTEMIRQIGRDRFLTSPHEERASSAIVEHRCAKNRECFMYRRDCPVAHPFAQIAKSTGLTEEDVAARASELARCVEGALDDVDFSPHLGRCVWAER